MITPIFELEGSAPHMTESQQEQQQLLSDVLPTYESTNTIWIRNFNQLCDTPPVEERRFPYFSRDRYNDGRIVPDSPSQKFLDSMRRYRRQWRELAHSAQSRPSSGDSWPPPLPRRTPNKLRKRQSPNGYE
ncbi:hypothetical protein F52700_1754 [Fusarium sp. NRRL 52700]|nr:hypothetical protein F52700_1754 [Fusarium sp. NRRL 52700]